MLFANIGIFIRAQSPGSGTKPCLPFPLRSRRTTPSAIHTLHTKRTGERSDINRTAYYGTVWTTRTPQTSHSDTTADIRRPVCDNARPHEASEFPPVPPFLRPATRPRLQTPTVPPKTPTAAAGPPASRLVTYYEHPAYAISLQNTMVKTAGLTPSIGSDPGHSGTPEGFDIPKNVYFLCHLLRATLLNITERFKSPSQRMGHGRCSMHVRGPFFFVAIFPAQAGQA